MKSEIVVTPEELYYIGKLLQARYIDYGYIAAMKDIGQNSAAIQQNLLRSLTQNGYLREDFGGAVTVEYWVKSLLTPLFFGEFESVAILGGVDKTVPEQTVRYHRSGDCMVRTILQQDGLHIANSTTEELRRFVEQLLPEGYVYREVPEGQPVHWDDVQQIYVFKNVVIGKQAEVKVYGESGGLLFTAEKNELHVLPGDAFCDEVYRILKGD